jgi:signal transduction histidine kinase
LPRGDAPPARRWSGGGLKEEAAPPAGRHILTRVSIRRWRADLLLAGFAVLLALASSLLAGPGKVNAGVLSALAVAGLRRRPKTVLFVQAVLALLSGLDPSPGAALSLVLLLVTLGTVAYRSSWPVTIPCAVLVYLVLLVPASLSGKRTGIEPRDLLPMVTLAGLTATPVASGRYLLGVRRAAAVAEERAADAEARRLVESEAARLTERTRLARDLHDIVAHHVGAMTLRASSAKLAVETGGDPAVAATALGDVATAGRRVLDELRGLLLLLREPDPGAGPGLLADPEATMLDAVEQVRASGVPIRVDVDAALGRSSLLVRATVARAVREALTNVLKHAGPGTPTAVTVVPVAPASLRAVVHNDPPVSARPALPPSGHGLTGMRERVALLGGVLDAGPTPTGGWSVTVELPGGEDR